MSTTTVPDGFDAIGHPIPFERRQSAYEAVRQDMAPEATVEEAMSLVNRVADQLERDRPFEAMKEATDVGEYGSGRHAVVGGALVLDVTGAYRLFAHLLAAPVSS
jgi:hypothetical protein